MESYIIAPGTIIASVSWRLPGTVKIIAATAPGVQVFYGRITAI
jgi:hypothetical protein